jgi:hypothetical protein
LCDLGEKEIIRSPAPARCSIIAFFFPPEANLDRQETIRGAASRFRFRRQLYGEDVSNQLQQPSPSKVPSLNDPTADRGRGPSVGRKESCHVPKLSLFYLFRHLLCHTCRFPILLALRAARAPLGVWALRRRHGVGCPPSAVMRLETVI